VSFWLAERSDQRSTWEARLDTIIFALIFLTLLALRGRRRWLALTLFFVSLGATLLLFKHHVTSTLPLNF
jgi:hypothetical protein